MPPHPDIEFVTAHDAFVRRLARSLMSEADRAEDLSQDTWVAALERKPGDLQRPRGWLAAAMRGMWSKGLRSEARRAYRERLAARPESSDPLEEVREREESRRVLVDALGKLAEPYRTCLLLRYFEGQPPRRIANRLGVSVETVKTRLKRGREQLAARLDREFDGGRSAWGLALVPLARLGGRPSLATSALVEVAIMSTKAKLLLGASALLGLIFATAFGVLALRAAEPAAPAPAEARAEMAAALEGGAEAPERALVAPGPPAERTAALSAEVEDAPPEVPTHGSLSVLILGSDGHPAPGVHALVFPWGAPSPDFHALETVTDAQGRFSVAALPPGSVGIYTALGAADKTKIEAGAESELTIQLPRGFDVLGEVVDEQGDPVHGADIWLSIMGPSRGVLVTTSDPAGRFRIPSLDGLGWVGALAAGYAPSPLQTISGGEGAEVPLRLVLDQRGGQLRGRVLDPDGEPVAGAVVLVGSLEHPWVDKEGWAPGPVRAVSGEDGVYQVRSVAPGDRDVAVRADGHAVWRSRVVVFEGAVTEQDVYLLAGADVVGTARAADGSPAERVEIAVEVWEELSYSTRTAADGSYRLEDLPAGRIELSADAEHRGRAAATLLAAAGETVEWNFVLGMGLALSGRVVDEAGNPLAGWIVEMSTSATDLGSFHHDRATTDADGRFRFVDCPDHTFEVTASAPKSRFPSVILTGQRPAQGDLLLRAPLDRMPTARISGTVVTKDGSPAGAAMVMLASSRYMTSPIEHPEAEAGRFAFEALPPGVWSIRVDFPGSPPRWSESHELQSGESWDAGRIVVGEQGTFRARLVRAGGAQGGALQANFQFDGHPIRDVLAVEDDEIRGGPLAPGTYTLDVFAEGLAASHTTLEVLDAEETVFEITLRPGLPARIDVGLDSSIQDASYGRLVVIDASGQTVSETWIWFSAERTARQELWLAPGSYRVEFRIPDGPTAQGALEVRADAEELAQVALWL